MLCITLEGEMVGLGISAAEGNVIDMNDSEQGHTTSDWLSTVRDRIQMRYKEEGGRLVSHV